mgnify:CR=1 FL=1
MVQCFQFCGVRIGRRRSGNELPEGIRRRIRGKRPAQLHGEEAVARQTAVHGEEGLAPKRARRNGASSPEPPIAAPEDEVAGDKGTRPLQAEKEGVDIGVDTSSAARRATTKQKKRIRTAAGKAGRAAGLAPRVLLLFKTFC